MSQRFVVAATPSGVGGLDGRHWSVGRRRVSCRRVLREGRTVEAISSEIRL